MATADQDNDVDDGDVVPRKAAKKKNAGRTPKQHDETLIASLAEIHCTVTEIAAVTGISARTLERRYAEIIDKGRECGKMSLRRAQWALAKKGHAAMLIFLGKNWLDQRDKTDVHVDDAEIYKALAGLSALRAERIAEENQRTGGAGSGEVEKAANGEGGIAEIGPPAATGVPEPNV